MKFDIKNRWSGEVVFSAEIECEEGAAKSLKLGLAVKVAVKAGANISGANISGADLSGANISGADLRSANLRSANLRSANLSGANISGADLRSANLRSANLRSANLSGANLSGANLSGANLSGANISGANLSGADLRSANLRSANLRSANLSGANISGANLSGADLSGANISGANLSGADLRSANLRSANLRSANLSGANLSGANLRIFKSCLWMTLTENPSEVPGLLTALKEGRVDGSQYEGECSCLVGTIAKGKGVNHTTLNPNADNPSERWFLMISKGDKPTDESGGGFASKMSVEWIEEWQSFQDVVELPQASPPPKGVSRLGVARRGEYLKYIEHQLANDHSIEVKCIDIWSKIQEDADHHFILACEALEEIATNKVALSEFAQTVASRGSKVVRVQHRGDMFFQYFLIFIIVCLSVALFVLMAK